MRVISEHACYGGVQGFYTCASGECATEMRFSVYGRPQAKAGAVPFLYYLAGLTSTVETVRHQGGCATRCGRTGAHA
jgi:S-formylglutathione hydrolase